MGELKSRGPFSSPIKKNSQRFCRFLFAVMAPKAQEPGPSTPSTSLVGVFGLCIGLIAGAFMQPTLSTIYFGGESRNSIWAEGRVATGARNASLPWLMSKLDYTKKYGVCSIGAGLSGTIFAERYATVLGKDALVIDSRDHIGGNCFDYVDGPTGVLMNKYVKPHSHSPKYELLPQMCCTVRNAYIMHCLQSRAPTSGYSNMLGASIKHS